MACSPLPFAQAVMNFRAWARFVPDIGSYLAGLALVSRFVVFYCREWNDKVDLY